MRYAVAACQTDFACPTDRREIGPRVDRMLAMVDGAVAGYRPFFPVRLVVFPDENHWILKGENSRYFYQEVHAWLAKYL